MPSIQVRRLRLQVIGIVVLLAGLSIGGFIRWRSPQEDAETDDDVLVMQENSKAYEREVERNVGTFGLLMSQWSQAIAKLGQPRPLAMTFVLVSGLMAGGFFLAASRLRE